MPNYEYKCSACDTVFDAFLPLKDYDKSVPCEKCGGKTTKVITAAVHGDEAAWIRDASDILVTHKTDKPIESRTELKRHLKQHGLEHAG